jgi:hypothetical protein
MVQSKPQFTHLKVSFSHHMNPWGAGICSNLMLSFLLHAELREGIGGSLAFLGAHIGSWILVPSTVRARDCGDRFLRVMTAADRALRPVELRLSSMRRGRLRPV